MDQCAMLPGGLPAIAVLEFAAGRPVEAAPHRFGAGGDVVLAAVSHPPRLAKTSRLAELMPRVLAQYGLQASANGSGISATSGPAFCPPSAAASDSANSARMALSGRTTSRCVETLTTTIG